MKSNNKNRGWCEEQDRLIGDLVEKYGTKNWAKVAEELHIVYGYRKKSGKQCRERWHNHLDPSIVKKSWTAAEEDIMFEEHKKHGNKWIIIAEKLPGRTDNAIKNHFYSTIRRSLRRISKFMGSKNSTIKLRKIKPSTLSKIFQLAQGKSLQQATTNSEKQSKEVSHEIQCKQIIHCLLEFSKKKFIDNKQAIDNEDVKRLEKILEQMVKINEIYENDKMEQAKLKRERQLEKNFDYAAQSEEESEENGSEMDMGNKQFEKSQERQISGTEIVITRSNRKSKPPTQYKLDKTQIKKQKKEKQDEDESKLRIITNKEDQNAVSTMKNMMSPLQKIQEEENENYLPGSHAEFCHKYSDKFNDIQGAEEDNNKFEFRLEFDDENFPDLDQIGVSLNVSPGIRNTPFALTPKTYEFMKDTGHHQTLKNQDCNQMVNRLINDIKKNTSGEHTISRGRVLQSPSSAFKQCY